MTDFNQNVLEAFLKSFSSEKIIDQDVKDFGQRVFSFIEGQKWVSRPLVLSPLICARYGWKCVNPNLLECVACSAKLSTQEPRIEIYDAYKSCLNKIVADLKDGHKPHCPWPLAPSPESFVKMVALPKEEALNQFVNRLRPCLDFEDSIPKLKDTISTELDLKEEDVFSLCKLAKVTSENINLIGMSIVSLAATGWTISSIKNGEMKTYVKCDSCQRTIWAKSFNLLPLSTGVDSAVENDTNSTKDASDKENRTDPAKESTISENGTNSQDDSTKEEIGAAKELLNTESVTNSEKLSSNKRSLVKDASCGKSRKKFKLDKRDFDPLEEHRPWCRWVSKTDATDKPTLITDDKNHIQVSVPGWQLYMKSLLRNTKSSLDNSFELHPSKEHVRNVRDLLDSIGT